MTLVYTAKISPAQPACFFETDSHQKIFIYCEKTAIDLLSLNMNYLII